MLGKSRAAPKRVPGNLVRLPAGRSESYQLRVLALTNMWPEEERPWHGIYVERQMRSLGQLGISVDVLPISGKQSAARSLGAYLRAAIRIVGLNRGPRQYDVLHAHTGHCALLACLQFRYPVVLSYVGYDIDVFSEDREGVRTRLERQVFRHLGKAFAATVVKSSRGAGHLPEGTRSRNTVIPNGVDRVLFAPMDRQAARQALSCDHTGPIALFAADPSRPTKDYGLAERVMEHARCQVPGLHLAICAGVDPAAMPIWMNAADALLLTSAAEGSPNVVKEALAVNLPIVSVDVGDVRENIEGVRHCHVCPREPDAMAKALVDVISALPERSDGREKSVHLGLEPIAVRLAGVYRRAASRGPGALGFRRRRGHPRAQLSN